MGRMKPLEGKKWSKSGYEFVAFRVKTTGVEFEFSKRAVAERAGKTSASNLAVAWTRRGVEEGLVGGVLQGRKQFVVGGASKVSRRGMWKLAGEVAGSLKREEGDQIWGALAAKTYDKVKEADVFRGRREVKEEVRREALNGWVRNTGGGEFTLEK